MSKNKNKASQFINSFPYPRDVSSLYPSCMCCPEEFVEDDENPLDLTGYRSSEDIFREAMTNGTFSGGVGGTDENISSDTDTQINISEHEMTTYDPANVQLIIEKAKLEKADRTAKEAAALEAAKKAEYDAQIERAVLERMESFKTPVRDKME